MFSFALNIPQILVLLINQSFDDSVQGYLLLIKKKDTLLEEQSKQLCKVIITL